MQNICALLRGVKKNEAKELSECVYLEAYFSKWLMCPRYYASTLCVCPLLSFSAHFRDVCILGMVFDAVGSEMASDPSMACTQRGGTGHRVFGSIAGSD